MESGKEGEVGKGRGRERESVLEGSGGREERDEWRVGRKER